MKVALYAHGGSMNHGCEALVRSVIEVLGTDNSYVLLSESPKEDFFYEIDKISAITKSTSALPDNLFHKLIYKIRAKLNGADKTYYNSIYRKVPGIVKDCDIAIAIGGDNYCYKGYLERFGVMNKLTHRVNVPTVLLGCSIEPTMMTQDLINDLKGYSLITARESITYNALHKSGIKNIFLCPDTAFTLPSANATIHPLLIPRNTVGVNISPLIMKQEAYPGVTMLNYERMIQYILENTNMNVALIPHVIWQHNDDRVPMTKLYDKFKETNRVFIQQDCNAMQLKYIISQCRYMIAARTHASIAAYSTNIPTIVVGYSVKAHGIAKDIFGDDNIYVKSVESLKNPDDLLCAFQWLQQNESYILDYYGKHMPKYIERVSSLRAQILNFA